MKRAIAIFVVLAASTAACTTQSNDTTTTVPAIVTTTSTVATTTTTIPPTTTAAPTTTTTIAPTTTTTVPPTTTTVDPGTVELSDEGVQAAATWVPFGTDDDAAIASVQAVLGDPTVDSGWIDSFSQYGTCPGSVVRGVEWGAFVMLFTQAETDFWSEGVPHFFSYYYTQDIPSLLTTEGIGIGATLAALEGAYGGPLFELGEAWFDPSVGAWTYDLQAWTGLWGFSTGQDPADVVTSINGGIGCGE